MKIILTRRMAIANGTCVSFCNQPKAQFGYLTRVTPVCRCLHPFCNAFGYLQESLKHILANLASPGYAPGTIAVNFAWSIENSMLDCLSNASQHVAIYFQPFTSCSEILVGNCNFFLPPLHLTPPLRVFPLEFLGTFWST